MATITLGYNRSSNGPDLAQVQANEQIVSHVFPNTTGETIRITHISAWVGNWGGSATMRYGIWAASSSSAAPGALLARTAEFSPTVNYMDGAGGQLRTAYLEFPYDLEPGQVICLGVATRGGAAGVAMYAAANISQPNESFYRKSISGTTLQSASGSTATNQGQLAIAAFGTTNAAPLAPIDLTPSGNLNGTNRPTFMFRHRDPDAHAASKAQIQVERIDISSVIWDNTFNTDAPDNAWVQRTYDGPTIFYHFNYRWRSRTYDIFGVPGPYSPWVTFTPRHNNRAPYQPSNPTVSQVSGTRQFQIGFDFSDPDYPYLPDGQQWEWFDAKRYVIRRSSDYLEITDTSATTTSSEKSALRSSSLITVPDWDTWYNISELHRDRWGAWSESRTVSIIARSGASVDKPSSPSGRVTNLTNPGDIVAVYRSTAGLNANGVRAQLRASNGALLVESGIVSVSVAPNGTITMAWPGSFTSHGLELGTEYRVTMTARDTAGNWSHPSEATVFETNARPSTPLLNSPANGNVVPVKPTLSVKALDDDEYSANLTVTIEGYNADDELISSHTATYNSGVLHSLTSPPFITAYGTYRWRAKSNDGFVDSPWSQMWSITYADVPLVTITGPSSPISTYQPKLFWTFSSGTSGQTHWRVRGYDGERLVYDTGERAGDQTEHTILADSFWLEGERWNRDETFQWVVSGRNSSGLWGDSEQLSLTLEYTPPTPLVIDVADAASFPGVQGTHYAQITHSQSEYPEGSFRAYNTSRVEIDGPGGAEDASTYIRDYARNTNAGQPWFADFDMTSGQWYRWGFWQEIQQGIDVIESDPVYVDLMVSWHGTLLHMPFDPLNNFIWLRYGETNGRYEPRRIRSSGDGSVQPMNGRAPWDYSGRNRRVDPSGTYTFITNDQQSHMQQLDTLDRMFDNQFADTSPDGRPHVMCWREGRGGRNGRLYVRLMGFEDAPSVGRTTQTVALEFAERYHVLGMPAEGVLV